MRKIKVRLTADLTKYLLGLVAGSEGITVGQVGRWSKNDDLSWVATNLIFKARKPFLQ